MPLETVRITSPRIIDGEVKTDDIAANAITQIVTVEGTTDATTTSTSLVDMPDMSLTITTGNNPVLILFTAIIMNAKSAAGGVNAVLFIDGTRVLCQGFYDSSSYSHAAAVAAHYVTTLAAGTHTIKIQWRVVGSGTARQWPETWAEGQKRVLSVIEFKR